MSTRIGHGSRAVSLAVLMALGCVTAAGAASTHQLLVLSADADLDAEILAIKGENFLWNEDTTVSVILAVSPS